MFEDHSKEMMFFGNFLQGVREETLKGRQVWHTVTVV